MGGSPPTEQLEQQDRFPDCRRALEFTRPAVPIGLVAMDPLH